MQLEFGFSLSVLNVLVSVPNSKSCCVLLGGKFLMANTNIIIIEPTRAEIKMKIINPASTNRKVSLADVADADVSVSC